MAIKKFVLTALAAAVMSGGAQAAVILENWTLDLRGLDGLANTSDYLIEGIHYAGFNDAPVHAAIDLATGTFVVNGKGVLNNLYDADGVIPTELNRPNGAELTFVFRVGGNVLDNSGGVLRFDHTDSPLWFLDFYVDNLADGGKAKATTGTGYDDGLKIATFAVSLAPNSGGVWHHGNLTGSLDGSDDLTFAMVSNPFGAFKDNNGNALAAGATIGWTDSNFDADSNNNGALDETRGGFGCTANNQSIVNFCAVEDGTVRLATEQNVPEPGSLALAALGLLGVAGSFRRRFSR